MKAGDKTRAAIFSSFSSELAGSTEQITAPAIAEMTAAEIAQVAGGIEQNNASAR